MAHSLASEGFTFLYNPDLSGNVTIHDHITAKSLEIPGTAIQAFLANLIRTQAVEAIEAMSDSELLRTARK